MGWFDAPGDGGKGSAYWWGSNVAEAADAYESDNSGQLYVAGYSYAAAVPVASTSDGDRLSSGL